MDKCYHCRHGDHEACWGTGCTCLTCAANDKDDFILPGDIRWAA